MSEIIWHDDNGNWLYTSYPKLGIYLVPGNNVGPYQNQVM